MKRFICLCVYLFAGTVNASVITTLYGDNDGFGVGITSGVMAPNSSNQGVGEAPLTDLRLIGGPFSHGPFNPVGNFDAFSVDGPITSAILTLRTGSFDSSTALDAPNRIFLDGLLVDSSFINGFSSANSNLVETMSFALDSSFFSLLSDGIVSLAGTHLSEASGSGSFQVDYLSLEITTGTTTTSVPEPASLALLGLGLAGIGFSRKKKSA